MTQAPPQESAPSRELEPAEPLSSAQAGMWFAQELDRDNPIFCGGQYVRIHGDVDRATFVRALRVTAHEADAFRLRIRRGPDGPVTGRVSIEDEGIDLPWLDLSGEPDPMAAAEARMRLEMTRPIHLDTGPPFAIMVFRIAPDLHLFFTRAHHAVCDGYASALIAGRVAEIYTALMAGAEVGEPLAPNACLLEDELTYRAGEQYAADREFWLDRLAGMTDIAGLADGRIAPAHTFHRETVEVSPAINDGLNGLAKAARTGSSAVLCAAVAIYLSRVRGQRRVVVGLPVAARFGPRMRHAVGMAANILPLVLDVDPEQGVAAFVRAVATEVRTALKHQRYRFEDLRRDLRLAEGERLFGPTVDVLRFQDDMSFAGHRATVDILSNGPVDDLNVVIYTGASIPGLRLCLDANPRLYSAEETAEHRERLALLVTALAEAAPELPVGELDVLRPGERDALAAAGRGEQAPLGASTFAELFAATVARCPDAVAVRRDGEECRYAELDARSNRLARRLIEAGAGPERFVAVALPRTVELVVALLAVLKTGAAYVPVDPSYPAERIGHMLTEADPALVLTTTATAAALPAGDAPRLLLDSLDLSSFSDTELSEVEQPKSDSPAYAIYTSGSTGRPKGVVIPQRGMVDFLEWAAADLGPDALGHVFAATSLSFDPSVLEFFGPLVLGGVCELLDSPLSFGQGPRTGGFAFLVPSVAAALLAGPGLPLTVHTMVLAGEAVTEELVTAVRAAVPGVRIANLYGPTENSVYATAWYSPSPDVPATPIGRPVRNTEIRLLDQRLRPAPAGATAELYVCGLGLARGYLGQPARTAERFVADPFGEPGSRLYRTGDLARWRSDGVLEYRGRADEQVKIRGFRVELGEVETVLRAQPGVRRAAAVIREDVPGNRTLVGYLVADEAGIDTEAVLVAARGTLPDFMVPSAVLVVPELPLTPTGKLDRRALPAPHRATTGRAPRDDRERALCGLFGELLGVPEVGVDDSFFALGGNSLLATRLLGRMRGTLGVDLEIRAVFEAPTVAGLAARAAELAADATAPAAPARPKLRPRARVAEDSR
jgi:amino acid adenylation domain-containing protein